MTGAPAAVGKRASQPRLPERLPGTMSRSAGPACCFRRRDASARRRRRRSLRTKSRCAGTSLTSLSRCVTAGESTRKRGGSGKPQQKAAAMCAPSLVERPERQAAVDRSTCWSLLSSESEVRVLPGASSGAPRKRNVRHRSGGQTCREWCLWKRRGSPRITTVRRPALPTPPRRPLATRVPKAPRVATPLDTCAGSSCVEGCGTRSW
jgi:hypothetical protein